MLKKIIFCLGLFFIQLTLAQDQTAKENFSIVIHGGAGTILKENMTPELEHAYRTTLACLLYTSPSPRDGLLSRMPSSA